jgi:hypothetical protein
MSSMLEQAIIDAAALKEAAIRNAEQEILEKYSQDIKEAVTTLLEEDTLEEDDAEADEEMMDQIPPASSEGEALCPCPDSEEVIELDLDALMMQADNEQPEAAEMTDRAELAEDIEEEKELRDLDEAEEAEQNIEEEINIDEQDLKDLVEELKFDYEPRPTGFASGTPAADLEQEQLVKAVREEIEEANKEKEGLKENLNNLVEENKKFKRIILQLKDKLDEVSVSNARLLYTNRVLENPSLNERQKAKLVETISKAQTIEKAKMIYEALQSAVDGTSAKVEKPESLNEVVSKQSTMLFSSRRDERKQSDHVLDRMQRLAGIKNS